AEAWLRAQRHAAGERRGLSGRDGNRVKITEVVKNDRLTIPTDIEREPACDICREANRALWFERKAFLNRIGASGVAANTGVRNVLCGGATWNEQRGREDRERENVGRSHTGSPGRLRG